MEMDVARNLNISSVKKLSANEKAIIENLIIKQGVIKDSEDYYYAMSGVLKGILLLKNQLNKPELSAEDIENYLAGLVKKDTENDTAVKTEVSPREKLLTENLIQAQGFTKNSYGYNEAIDGFFKEILLLKNKLDKTELTKHDIEELFVTKVIDALSEKTSSEYSEKSKEVLSAVSAFMKAAEGWTKSDQNLVTKEILSFLDAMYQQNKLGTKKDVLPAINNWHREKTKLTNVT